MMRVRIICYEALDNWIAGKYAKKMNECLIDIGIRSDIADQPDLKADINHHIFYGGYDGNKSSIDTLMITHIDNISKLCKLKNQLNNAEMGICMSRETMERIVELGIPRNRVSYINPAHDGVIIPRPKVIGITCRVQEDGRKREQYLTKLASDICSKYFSFKIMGDGWDAQVSKLKKIGFNVEYYNHFEYNKYVEIIQSIDYYLYFGQDEGQMGFIDAAAAGVETIVTPQGYHLDAADGISYSFNTYSELINIFESLTKKRMKIINSVSTWSWEKYTQKHMEIWKYLLSKEKSIFYQPSKEYLDGINSVERFNNIDNKYSFRNIKNIYKLFSNNIKQYIKKRKKKTLV
jgi:hypothetical protein